MIKVISEISEKNGYIMGKVSSMHESLSMVRFLAPLAEGQRAIVMALCPLCPLCVCLSVNSSFKKLLLRNYRLDLYQTSQECSLGGPLSNSFK